MRLFHLEPAPQPKTSATSVRSRIGIRIVGKCCHCSPVDFDQSESTRYLPGGGRVAPSFESVSTSNCSYTSYTRNNRAVRRATGSFILEGLIRRSNSGLYEQANTRRISMAG